MRQQLIYILLLTALFTFVKQAEAQNLQRMSIEREEAGTGIPVFTQHPDKAGIVIESSVPNLRFSSNMQGIVDVREPAAGRYILIVEPFTQIIRVDAENFVQERFRVGNPRARDVLYFSVSPQQEHSDVISVIFNVEPEDADLFLDGQEVETNTTVQLPAQGYELRLERDGYRSINEVVNVSPDNILFNYNMEEIDILPVRILSNVEGARVFVDGTERGQIDGGGGLGLFLFPGTYSISLSASGYLSQNEILQVSENGANETMIELERMLGELYLKIVPEDASIMLNRQDYSGQSRIELAPGRYRLDVEKQNYESFSEAIEIQLNEEISRDIELEPHLGTLRFSVRPSNASVELLDSSDEIVRSWSGLQLLRNLKAGQYMLRITADEYSTKQQQIRIIKDETLEINIELEGEEGSNRDTNTAIVEVTNPSTGRTWMDRNLGAIRAATTLNDAEAYGDLYQWGRSADGHQKRNSTVTSELSINGEQRNGNFIIAPDSLRDWRTPQNDNLWLGDEAINNPCPDGFRLPTEAEWEDEIATWDVNNKAGAYASLLKLPVAGYRDDSNGSLLSAGSGGLYWSSTVLGSLARGLRFAGSPASMGSVTRAYGAAVRCIKQ